MPALRKGLHMSECKALVSRDLLERIAGISEPRANNTKNADIYQLQDELRRPATGYDEAAEHVKFEAWFSGKYGFSETIFKTCSNDESTYYYSTVQDKWNPWRACAMAKGGV